MSSGRTGHWLVRSTLRVDKVLARACLPELLLAIASQREKRAAPAPRRPVKEAANARRTPSTAAKLCGNIPRTSHIFFLPLPNGCSSRLSQDRRRLLLQHSIAASNIYTPSDTELQQPWMLPSPNRRPLRPLPSTPPSFRECVQLPPSLTSRCATARCPRDRSLTSSSNIKLFLTSPRHMC